MFQVPCVDWFRPIVQQDIQFSAAPMSSAARRRSSASIPQISATRPVGLGGEFRHSFGEAVGELGDECSFSMIGAADRWSRARSVPPSPAETGQPSRRWCCAADRRRSAGAALTRSIMPQEQDRMAVSRVATDEAKKHVGVIEILIRAGRASGTRGAL